MRRKLVLFLFSLLYHRLAFLYDAAAWLASRGSWRRWQRAALPYVSGVRVLELGFGPGHLMWDLAKAGYTSFGIDISPDMVRLARRNLKRRSADATLVRGDAASLPFRRGCFSTVIATHPTVFAYQEDTLAEVRRVLVPGGILIIVDGGEITGKDALSRLLGLLSAVVGQGASVDAESRLQRAGFSAETHCWQDGHSRVRIVVGRKT